MGTIPGGRASGLRAGRDFLWPRRGLLLRVQLHRVGCRCERPSSASQVKGHRRSAGRAFCLVRRRCGGNANLVALIEGYTAVEFSCLPGLVQLAGLQHNCPVRTPSQGGRCEQVLRL